MEVDPDAAVGQEEYGGKTFYFCSKPCQERFDANPREYAETTEALAEE
jgi:YHS domain-containing protein